MAAMLQVYHRCGVTADAENAVEDAQSIELMDEPRLLKDLEIENICKVILIPGGAIADPSNAGQIIPNPGFHVALRADKTSSWRPTGCVFK